MCFSKCFSPCGSFGDNPRRVHSMWFSSWCFPQRDCFDYNPCDQKRAVCVSLNVLQCHVVVLVTTPEACTVCGSLAGVFHPCDQKHSLCGSLAGDFPPCDGFSYNPYDQKGAVCGSLAGVSHPCDGFG
jgi:hypothetical protein